MNRWHDDGMPLTGVLGQPGLPMLSISSCVPDDATLAPPGDGATRVKASCDSS